MLTTCTGAQWLTRRVLDWGPTGCEFDPRWCHYVVSLCKTHLSLLSTGSTQEDPSQHNLKIVDWDIKNQIKKNKKQHALSKLKKPHTYT